MSKQPPPMAGGQTAGQELVRVAPGPIRGGHCPPPREIMVLEARKVYDFCTQDELLERCFFVPGIGPEASVVTCEITNVTCQEIMEREPLADLEGKALVSIQVNLTLNLLVVPGPGLPPIRVQRQIAFPKRVVLCAPLGTEVSCEVRGTCICTIQPPAVLPPVTETEPNVCCTIQLSITLTSTAPVKVLVPTFGLVLPKECTVAPVLGVTVPPDCPQPVGVVVDPRC